MLSQPEHLDRVDGVTPAQIAGVLDILHSTFDLVVVDAPHVFNEITLEIFDRSSTIVLMAEPSIPSVRAARRSLEIFQKLNFLVSPDRVRLVVNRRGEQSAISIAADRGDARDGGVWQHLATTTTSVSMAINVGKPLCGEHDGLPARRVTSTPSPAKLVPSESDRRADRGRSREASRPHAPVRKG